MIRPPSYWHRLADATSQWFNVALLNGNANESLSGRSWRKGWYVAEALIDRVAGDGHCRGSYLWDVSRAVHLTEDVSSADLSLAREQLKHSE